MRGIHKPLTLPADEILAEIGRLISCEVELVERSTTIGKLYLIVPEDRKCLRSGFWEAVRRSPCAGAWASPERAFVGFTAHSVGWLQESKRRSASAVERFVREQLGEIRSAPARVVIDAARSAEISTAALHRAATRLGVRRQKISMTEGWLWTLPPEGDPKFSTGASG